MSERVSVAATSLTDRPLVNWGGNVSFGAARLHRPRSVDELQQLVASSSRIRPLGTAHSFSRVADTDGDLVTTADLASPVDIDVAAGIATVPSGMRYAQLADALDARGLALPNLGSLPHISVAGACATGTHGSGNDNQCLATAVVGIEYVRADGELVDVDAADAGFGGAVLALGARGVTTRLRLRLVPAFDVGQRVWLDAPLTSVVDSFDDVMAAGYSVSVFSTTTRPEVVDSIWVKTRADDVPADGTAWGAVAATADVHPIATMSAEAVTAQRGIVGPWHERLPHFRANHVPSGGTEQQSEYLVPAVHGAEAFHCVHRLGLGDVLLTLEIRSVAADELWLSPCHDRATVAVHFTWRNDDEAVAAAIGRVEAALAPFDARPHWGKVFALDPDLVRSHYPRLREFRDLAAHDDPERKFGNDFLQTYVY